MCSCSSSSSLNIFNQYMRLFYSPFEARQRLDCKTVGFFLKISKEIGKAWRKSRTRAKRASLTLCQTFQPHTCKRDLFFMITILSLLNS